MEFLLNMLENDDYNVQTKFGVHITPNIFKLTKFLKSRDYTNPPDLPILKLYPTPREGGGRFEIILD